MSILEYNPIESVARCPPPTPPESLRGYNTPECQLHTSKVLLGIERFDALLTLPTNILTHTPFIICMIANNTITHLSACRYFYQGQQLRLARERIRLSMGTLKTLGEYWALGKRTYQEIGIIAREILSLVDRTRQDAIQEVPRFQTIASEESSLANFSMPDNLFDFCDLYDFNFHEAMGSMLSIPAGTRDGF